MKLHKKIGIATVAGIICMAGAAQADQTTALHIAGVGSAVATLDWLPGSSYAQGGSGNASIRDFPVFFQASLGGFVDTNNATITSNSGLGSNYFVTLVAGFHEAAAISVAPIGLPTGSSATFSSAGGDSYAIMYLTNKAPDNLSGKGFSPINPLLGQTFTQVLAGTIDPNSVFGNFAATNSLLPNVAQYPTTGPNSANLDQHGTNDWSTLGPGNTDQLTVRGGGSTSLDVDVTSYDTSFFLDPITLLSFVVTSTTENKVPYNQADPSKTIVDGFNNSVINTVGTLGRVNGNINGLGTGNILFQTDASSSFFATTAVPEPSTFVLSGLGILLAGCFMRRRNG